MLIKAKEAADRLNIGMHTMYNLLNSKLFTPTVILGEKNGRKQYRVDSEKLEKWINEGGMRKHLKRLG